MDGVCARHGFSTLITFTLLGEGTVDATVPVLFDREDPAAVARARGCYEALLEAGRSLGCFPYRLPVAWQGRYQAGPQGEVARRLKAALDPAGILAPGRYAGLPEEGR